MPHGTSAGNMLRAGGLLDRVLDADRSLRRRAAVADGAAMRRSSASSHATARHDRRSAGAHAGGTRGAAAGDRAGQLSEPGPDRIGAHSSRRGARQRHHPLARREGGDRPRAGRAVHAQRFALRAVGSTGLASRDGALFDEHRPVLVVAANPGPGVLGSAAAADGAAPRRASAWRSIRAGTTSPTS